MADRFYIWEDDERHGPYSEGQVERMLEDRVINFSHECENARTGETVVLDELFEVAPDEEEQGGEEEWEYEEGEEGWEDDEGETGDGDLPPPGTVLFLGHPTILRYGGALLLAALGVAFGLWLGPRDLWFFIGGFGLATVTLIAVLIDRNTQVYTVTPKRVELVWGLLAKSSNEVRIEDIRTINVHKRGIAGLIGVGTVEFSSTGDKIDVAFTDIWGAQRVKSLVRELQDELE